MGIWGASFSGILLVRVASCAELAAVSRSSGSLVRQSFLLMELF